MIGPGCLAWGLAALAGLCGPAAGARAGQVMHADATGGVGQLVAVKARFEPLDDRPATYYAGTLTASLDGGPAFDAYCVDLYHSLQVGGGGSTFVVNALPIALLEHPGGNGAGVGFLYQTFAGVVATPVERAALQVAIWKVVYDNGGLLATGRFTVEDPAKLESDQHRVFAKATEYLSAYDGTDAGFGTWLKATTHPKVGGTWLHQDLVGPATLLAPTIVSTPEPPTVAAGLIGSAIVVGLTLRRRIAAGRR